MNENHILEKYYENYLRKVRKLSESSIGHYKNAINNISRFLVKENKIQKTLYEIKDMDELEKIKEFLYHDNDFIIQNQRGNRMYSSGLNNYLEFAKGENFVDIKNNSICLDIEMPIESPKEYVHKTWKRSSIINRQVMEMADYLCEIDNAHKTFIAEKTRNHIWKDIILYICGCRKSFRAALMYMQILFAFALFVIDFCIMD